MGWWAGGLAGWRAGGLAGWRAGGLAGWRAGGLAGWRAGGLAGWRAGGLAGWRAGGLAGWRVGELAFVRPSIRPSVNTAYLILSHLIVLSLALIMYVCTAGDKSVRPGRQRVQRSTSPGIRSRQVDLLVTGQTIPTG